MVELQLEPKYEGYIKQDATALLRTKTGLKDMFLEVDPGRGRAAAGERARSRPQNTAPDVDPDEVLSALDGDTRDYLKLLRLRRRARASKGRGSDLQRDLRPPRAAQPRPRPAHQGRRAPAQEPLEPGEQVRQAHARAGHQGQGDRPAGAGVQRGVRGVRLPGRADLRRRRASCPARSTRPSRRWPRWTPSAASSARRSRRCARRSASSTRPTAPCCRSCARPRLRSATRSGRSPGSRRPYTADLGTAARDLNKANPDLTTSFNKLNRFFNMVPSTRTGRRG